MKDRVLSVEQMEHLGELGVDISSNPNYMNYYYDWFDNPVLAYDGTGDGICRALTLEDILEMMPRTIPLYPIRCISLWYDEGWCISYSGCEDAGSINNESPLDAAYNVLCWLAENKLLAKEEEK